MLNIEMFMWMCISAVPQSYDHVVFIRHYRQILRMSAASTSTLEFFFSSPESRNHACANHQWINEEKTCSKSDIPIDHFACLIRRLVTVKEGPVFDNCYRQLLEGSLVSVRNCSYVWKYKLKYSKWILFNCIDENDVDLTYHQK